MSFTRAFPRLALLAVLLAPSAHAAATPDSASKKPKSLSDQLGGMSYRSIGPWRAGRVVAVSGVRGKPLVYYFGSCGGGVWKTSDGGSNWENLDRKSVV